MTKGDIVVLGVLLLERKAGNNVAHRLDCTILGMVWLQD